TQLERLEVEAFRASDDNLPVEYTALRQLFFQGSDKLGVVTVERPFIATLNEDLVPIAEHQSPKSVPLGLENPPLASWELTDRLGNHSQSRWIPGEPQCELPQVSPLPDDDPTVPTLIITASTPIQPSPRVG